MSCALAPKTVATHNAVVRAAALTILPTFFSKLSIGFPNPHSLLFPTIMFLYKLKKNNYLPQKLISSSLLRFNILNQLKKSRSIETNFIKRIKYRAGVKNEIDKTITTKEFYNNLKESQYAVCVRGGGNFSVRFYEALAMGRIPLFINTDCLLPFLDYYNWKDHIVWVDLKERKQIIQFSLEFHKSLSQHKMNELFKKNRLFWEQNLTLKGYFETIFKNELNMKNG